MNTSFIIEGIGFLGSALVLVSFLMASVKKLRIVNTIGSFIFMVYALIIHSYPTAIMNAALVIINLRFLWRMRSDGKEYELVPVDRSESFLRYFLQRYAADIQECFPQLALETDRADCSYIITCQGKPAGVFLGEKNGSEVDILLDYSTPEFRDFSLGTFLMDKLKEAGIRKLSYKGPDKNHQEYLEKMGFTKIPDGYEKEL